ncbi:hypothetical protein ACLB2K_007277 [Fragaria x ananassa]
MESATARRSCGGLFEGLYRVIMRRNSVYVTFVIAGAFLGERAFSFVGFSLAMFLFYSLVPILLKINGSTMLNLSLLTSDMWAVLIRIFAYHQKVDWMYFVAFAIVVVGLVIYSWGDKDEEQRLADVTHEDVERSKRFDEEVGSVTRNRGTMAGTSKAGGDNNKDEAPASSID